MMDQQDETTRRRFLTLAGNYQPKDDIFAEVEGATASPVNAPPEERKREAEKAKAWFTEITADSFG